MNDETGTIKKCIVGLVIQLITNVGSLVFMLGIMKTMKQTPTQTRELIWLGGCLVACVNFGMSGYLACGTIQRINAGTNQFVPAYLAQFVGLLLGFFAVTTSDPIPLTNFGDVLLSLSRFWIPSLMLLTIGYLIYLSALSWLAGHFKATHLQWHIFVYLMAVLLYLLLTLAISFGGPDVLMGWGRMWGNAQAIAPVVMQLWFIYILAAMTHAAWKHRRSIAHGESP